MQLANLKAPGSNGSFCSYGTSHSLPNCKFFRSLNGGTFADHNTSVNRSVDMAVLYDFPLRPSAIKVYYIVGVIVAQLAMAGVESVMMVRGSSHFTEDNP